MEKANARVFQDGSTAYLTHTRGESARRDDETPDRSRVLLHTLSNTRVTLTHSEQEFKIGQRDEMIGRDWMEIEFPDGSLIRVNLATGETLGTWARVFVHLQGETDILTHVFDEGGSR